VPRTDCLSAEELIAFHLGNLPEDMLEKLAAHVEKCGRCEAAAQKLDDVSDPTVAAYRRSVEADPFAAGGAPRQVGDYEVLEELGRGGMGVVYKARHTRLHRTVALKMLPVGSFAERDRLLRFRGEAEAVARLQHPNIVQIYEVGEYAQDQPSPRPYFTLEHVDGGSLADRLKSGPQSPHQMAAWLEVLARAVGYAHQQGIIHRDLKPSNILLARAPAPSPDGASAPANSASQPGDASLVPKICDFGVAKLLAGAEFQTLSGMLVGTAEYMAPEQAEDKAAVGPAADVYSLGAVLYAGLTGRPPFQGTTVLATLAQLKDQEPVPPRRLQPLVDRDLETICLKCLQKEPAKRYASALGLAEELRRYLAKEPILARPTGSLERAVKWMRRRPVDAALLAAVVLVTVVGFALVLWQWSRAEEKAAAALAARREADRLLAGALLDQGTNLCEKGDVNRGLLNFVRALQLAVEAKDADFERVARINLAAWPARLIRQRALFPHDCWVWAVALSPDAKIAATGGDSGVVQRWDVSTGTALGAPLRHRWPIWAIAFSPDCRVLLTGSGTFEKNAGEVHLWDAASGQPLHAPLTFSTRVFDVLFSRDGTVFLTVSADHARLWSTDGAQALGPPLKHPKELLTAALSPDGKTVLTGGEDGTARFWNGRTGAPLGAPVDHAGAVEVVAFSPDGHVFLTGCKDASARLWKTEDRTEVAALSHRGPVKAAAFSADGRLVATGCDIEDAVAAGKERLIAGEARLWDVASGRRLSEPLFHPNGVRTLAFSPDGRLLATGCRDGCARFFGVASGKLVGNTLQHEGSVRALLFSRDGRLALTGSAGGDKYAAGRLWILPDEVKVERRAAAGEGPDAVFSPHVARPSPLPQSRGVYGLAFAPAGDNLISTGAGGDGSLLWSISDSRVIARLPDSSIVRSLAFSPTDKLVAVGSDGSALRLWDCERGAAVRDFPEAISIITVAFAPDGKLLLTAGRDRHIRLFEVATGRQLTAPWTCEGAILAVTFRDNDPLWLEATDRQMRCWQATPAAAAHLVWEQSSGARSAVFRGDGAALLTCDGQHVQLRDGSTGRPRGPTLDHRLDVIRALAFNPDGTMLATGGQDKTVRLWDAATGKPLGPPLHHREPVFAVAFHPNGRSLATGSDDHWSLPSETGVPTLSPTLQIWQIPQALTGDITRIKQWAETLTGIEIDGEGVIRP
jgi:WD40 repeat protein/serine/threonine protein kinase